ncbi:MAG: zinc-ribbon domain-containing protein [Betaproteobacteria bacterium]|nr:zinc-ribbon domain-containing protein [Betaproteobacteria bacterium]
MAMVTRCPNCSTLFRVTPQQLQVSHGQVRCGRCMTVFDGFKALAVLRDDTPLEPTCVAPAPEKPADAALPPEVVGIAPTAPVPSAETAAVQSSGAPAEAEPAVLEFDFERKPAVEEKPWRFAPQPAPADTEYAAQPGPPSAQAPASDPGSPQAAMPRRRGAQWPWAVGAVVLIFSLVAQAAYLYRTDLAAYYPVLRPHLVAVCELAGCTVPLPQRPRLINVEASDLQATDPDRPGLITLTATLRNHAGIDLAYPALDLVLTNTKDHTLARRIFLPEEYLGRGQSGRRGIPANAEITVSLTLDTGDLGAAGFRLDLLPAPLW